PSRSPIRWTESLPRWSPSFLDEGKGHKGPAWLRYGLAALFLFGAFVAVMALSQDDLLFPTSAVPPPGPLPAGAERFSIHIPAKERLHGVHIPPSAPVEGARTLVLGFGGNAWNGADVASYLHQLYPFAHTVAFHYRGYSPSTGRPSAQALLADAPLVLDSAIERVEPERVLVVGFSIGSGIAASLAQRPVDGAILVTPFDSLTAVARDLYPWLPVGLLFRHEMNAAEYLQGSEVPVAMLAAERDDIIPPERTEALRGKAGKLVYDRTIAGAGHNDLYGRAEFEKAMQEAFAALVAAGERSGRMAPKNAAHPEE
ncbi:MAG TPA: hypothetical protein VMK31_06770, partial [Sphingomicrobium sp.]|nr:hypothetical protein [Sphingomicrobium sp.]